MNLLVVKIIRIFVSIITIWLVCDWGVGTLSLLNVPSNGTESVQKIVSKNTLIYFFPVKMVDDYSMWVVLECITRVVLVTTVWLISLTILTRFKLRYEPRTSVTN